MARDLIRTSDENVKGSYWFRRLVRELRKISKHIKVIPIRHGFVRIYWKEAYVHEAYKEMPMKGFVWYTDSPYKESLKLVQQWEDDGTIQRKVKNYVEGYWEALKAIKLRIFQFKNNEEHYRIAKDMYRHVVVK